jgi:hypothetical protein
MGIIEICPIGPLWDQLAIVHRPLQAAQVSLIERISRFQGVRPNQLILCRHKIFQLSRCHGEDILGREHPQDSS